MLVDISASKQYNAARLLDREGLEYTIINNDGNTVRFDIDSNDDDILDKLNEINVG